MKKTWYWILLLISSWLLIPFVSYAKNNVSVTIPVTVEISEIFELTINPDYIDFEKLENGETSKEKNILVKAKSNCGKNICLQIKGENFINPQLQILEIENIEMRNKLIEGHGKVVDLPQLKENYQKFAQSKFGINQYVYSTVDTFYTLTIPEDSLAGIYKTILTITMTEK